MGRLRLEGAEGRRSRQEGAGRHLVGTQSPSSFTGTFVNSQFPVDFRLPHACPHGKEAMSTSSLPRVASSSRTLAVAGAPARDPEAPASCLCSVPTWPLLPCAAALGVPAAPFLWPPTLPGPHPTGQRLRCCPTRPGQLLRAQWWPLVAHEPHGHFSGFAVLTTSVTDGETEALRGSLP